MSLLGVYMGVYNIVQSYCKLKMVLLVVTIMIMFCALSEGWCEIFCGGLQASGSVQQWPSSYCLSLGC